MDLIGLVVVLCMAGVTYAGMPVSTCQDLDTQACMLFATAKPDLCSDDAFRLGTCKRFCGACPLECYSCPTPVLHPEDCNNTITCGANMTCMTKHLLALDGHHEYIMVCERKEICDGLSLGFAFGKRSFDEETEADFEEHSRNERDVTLSCCDTDFCNVPQKTTTTTMPTTITTKGLGQCDRDIVFVVDDSGSVGSTNFAHAKDFIKQIVNALAIGPNHNQVSVETFSSQPHINWYLNSYHTKASLLNAVSNVRYISGTTRTGDAIERVRTSILTTNRGDRAAADNVVIVMSDGQSTDKSDTLHEANLLHTVVKDVISIVVGQGVDKNELNAIATDYQHVLDVRGYGDLSVLIPKVLALICR